MYILKKATVLWESVAGESMSVIRQTETMRISTYN